MGLLLPHFENETQEADWWYDNRALVEAEFLVAGAAGELKRRRAETGELEPEPAWAVPAEEIKAARELLEKSGIWLEGQPSRAGQPPASAKHLRKAS